MTKNPLSSVFHRLSVDKTPIAAYEHWIKTPSSNEPSTMRRKRSVLSNISYNSSEDSSDEDEDDLTPPTPAASILTKELPGIVILK